MKSSVIFFLTLCIAANVQAGCINPKHSQIITPKIGSIITTQSPIIIGVVTTTKHKPVKNRPVSIYVDERKVDIATTNSNGVWSYKPKFTQLLSDGFHTIQACIKSSLTNSFWMKGTIFSVQPAINNQFCKSHHVDEETSSLIFPFDDSFINIQRPIVIGSLLDFNNDPVSGETVSISLDDSYLTTVTSDCNGVFSFALTRGLCDGSHTLDAFCVESEMDLTPISFIIDTVIPEAPTIINPAENQTITSGLVVVAGTSKQLAMITTCVDDNMYGDISYADEFGNWDIEYELEDGTHYVNAQAEDLAGNVSPVSTPRMFETHDISS